MRTSGPGSSSSARPPPRHCSGFTLIEVIVVMAIVAIASALVSLALRDGAQSRLEEEGTRLSALLESARAEARASGIAVAWAPLEADAGDGAHFRFAGLPASVALPNRWLGEGVSAEVIGARTLLLGPEPVLPAQRVLLRLGDRRLMLASDGLAAFGPLPAGSASP